MDQASIIRLVALAFGASAVAQVFNFIADQVSHAINENQHIHSWLAQEAHSFRRFWLFLLLRVGVPILGWVAVHHVFGYFRGVGTGMPAFYVALLLFACGSFLDYHRSPRVIPISWSFIYAGYFAIIWLVLRYSVTAIATMDMTQLINLVSPIRDLIVVAGTVLGVCMTILWTMDAGNLQGFSISDRDLAAGECRHKVGIYRGVWALYMLTHFFAIFVAITAWMIVPLLKRIGLLETLSH